MRCGSPRSWHAPWAAGWLAGFAAAVLLCAGLPAAEFEWSRVRRVDVPAESPELWPPQRPPVVVPRDEFERLLEAAQTPPRDRPSVVLEQAVYEATLLGHTLAAGKLHVTVRRQTPLATWQRMAPWNLALAGLSWTDREAVSGTGPDGTYWLWADRAQGELTGTWSLRGRAVADRTEFELQWPSAVSSVLRVHVPSGSRIQVEHGAARRIDAEGQAAFDTWELQSLDPHVLRFQATRPPRDASSAALVAVRQQLTAEIREDHIRFQARFVPEVWGGEVRELRFSIPATVELYSVGMASDTTLPWTREATPGPRHQVRVELPEAGRGTLRPVLLEGIIGSRASAATALPQLELVNGLFLSGQQMVTVMRPLQIAALRMTGCRQVAPLVSSSDGETLAVEQLVPDARLTLDLRRPTPAMTAQVLSELDLRADVWTQTTHLLWSANSGSVFQVAARLPAAWEVTAVEAFHPAAGSERVIWEKIDESGGTTQVRVEFLQAIQPGQPRLVRMLSRRKPQAGLTHIDSPLPVPLDCAVNDCVVALLAAPRFRATLAGDSAFAVASVDSLAQAWWKTPEWKSVVADPNGSVFLRGHELSRLGSLRLDPEPTPVAATGETEVHFEAATIREDYRLTVLPEGTCERLLVWLSEAAGDVAWTVESPPGLPMLAQRLPAEQLPIWSLPLEGELWELRLAPTEDTVVLSGRRERPRAIPGRAGLLYLPQARPFSGVVALHAPQNLGVHVVARGLTGLPDPRETSSAAVETWRYAGPEAELRWVSRAAPKIGSSAMARMELHTLVSAPDEPFDYHRAVCRLENHAEPLTFRFPSGCEPLAATWDGREISPLTDGVVVVPASRAGGPRELVLSYRTPSRSGFVTCPRTVSTPACDDVVWTGFRWEFSLPPTSHLWAEPTRVRLAEPLRRPSWTERLFGPFGRSAEETVFWPWSATAWAQLVAERSRASTTPPATDAAWSSPAGWQHYVAYAPEPPGDMTFQIWRGGRIQLFAWLAVLLGVVGGGLGLRRKSRGFVVYLLAALLAGAWVVEPPLTECVGGLWTGVLLAQFLPRRWFERTRRPSDGTEPRSGSTASYPRPIWPVATAVLCASAGLAAAQRPPVMPAVDEPVVWVPVDADGRPSQRLSVVYTTEGVLQGLRSAAQNNVRPQPPGWLFSRAVYRLKAGAELPAVVFAAFDIVIVGPELSVSVPLPLQGASLSSCRVDGHPAALTSLPEGKGYQVTIARREMPVSAVGEPAVTRHTIMIELYRPWRLEGREATVAFEIPAVHECRVLLDATSTPHLPRLPLAAGQLVSGDATAVQAIEYGPVREFVGERSIVGGAGRRPLDQCPVDTAELLIAGPNLVQSRTKTVFSPPPGSVQRLTLTLPPQAVLQHLETTPPSSYEVRIDASGSRVAHLEFANGLRQPAVVRCDYVLRKPAQSVEFLWHGLSWTSPDDVACTPRQQILAVAALSDLQVQPHSVEDSGLAPLSLEAARDLLADLLGDVRPKALYQVGSERPIQFRTSTIPQQRRLAQWRQQGILRRDRLAWTVHASIEPPSVPAYSHVLIVDRRLQIESISARERNAERVLRWSETRTVDAKWVTVFLTDPMTETQQLTVVGSMPIGAGESFSLPNVWLENAEFRTGRLEMAADKAWQLEWTSLQKLKRVAKASAISAESGNMVGAEADWPTWEFEQQDFEWRATARLRPYDESFAVRAVHALIHATPDAVELHSRVELPPTDRPAPVTLDVPPPWQVTALPQAPGVRVESKRDGTDGRTLLTLQGSGAGPLTFRWQAKAEWSQFPPRACPLPSVRTTRQREVLAWLAEVAPPPFSPRLQADPAAAPPPWANDWFLELAPMAPAARWLGKLSDQPSSWPMAPVQAPPAKVRVAWLEHRLWRQTAKPDWGATWIRLSQPVSQLTVHAPSQHEITAAIVDGHPGVLLTARDTESRLSAAEGQLFREAVVLWRGMVPTVAPWSGVVEVIWPALPQAQVTYQAVTVFPADDEVFWPFHGWSRSDWIDRLLLRLESLADAGGDDPPPWHAARLRTGYALAAEKLAHRTEALGNSQSPRHVRWQSIVERIDRLSAPAAADRPPASQAVPTLEEVLIDHPRAVYGSLDPQSDHTWFWRIDGWWLRAVLGGSLFLGAMLLLRVIQRSRWRDWLRGHPHRATALLGLLWWLCLTPSIFGLAILAWTGYRAVSRLTAARVVTDSSQHHPATSAL